MQERKPERKDTLLRDTITTLALAVILAGGIGVGLKYLEKAGEAKAIEAIAASLQENESLEAHSITPSRDMPSGLLITFETINEETVKFLRFTWRPQEDDPHTEVSKVLWENVKFNVEKDPNTEPTVLFTGINPQAFKDGYLKPSTSDIKKEQIVIVTLFEEALEVLKRNPEE